MHNALCVSMYKCYYQKDLDVQLNVTLPSYYLYLMNDHIDAVTLQRLYLVH